MKRRGCLLPVQTLALLISSSLSLAFRTHIHVQRTSTTTATTKTATWDDLGGDHGRPFFRLHEHAARSSSSASRGALRMARASTLRADQKRRVKAATPVILSPKQHRAAKRARREYFREKFARSGTRLIKLQKEDPGSFYIGFVGTNRAGRGDALKAIETFLKKATELKARMPRVVYCAPLSGIMCFLALCSTLCTLTSTSTRPVNNLYLVEEAIGVARRYLAARL